MSKECERACGTCPFLTKNFGRGNPESFESIKAEGKKNGEKFLDWYSEKNLARLWRDGLRKGEAMICHSTDSTASSYGGTDAKPGNEKVCTGALSIVFRHLKFLEGLIKQELKPQEIQKQYREFAGKYPMTQNGQYIWAWAFATGKVEYPFGLDIPRALTGETIKEASVPWRDDIVNKNS
jgi:hypothetical protein